MQPVTAWKNQVGFGWHSLLDQLHQELIILDPDYKTAQVKEKFAGLRVYVDVSDPGKLNAVYDVIHKYEKLSAGICENCGNPGEITNTVWRKTFCPSCTRSWMHDRKNFWMRGEDA